MRDILFDEKIAGSFHFTPGQAYEEADNGNRSQVHWDMVNIQRPDYGGGRDLLRRQIDPARRRVSAQSSCDLLNRSSLPPAGHAVRRHFERNRRRP